MTLSVDYHPDDILSRIIQKTGISPNCFPPKTIMWISKEKISVKKGYNGTSLEINISHMIISCEFLIV